MKLGVCRATSMILLVGDLKMSLNQPRQSWHAAYL